MMNTAVAMPEPVASVDAHDTSRAALDSFGLKKRQRQMRDLVEVIQEAHRDGSADMSLSETQQAYERKHNKRIDLGRVSARVSELVAAKVLTRKEKTRPCTVTGKPVHPFYVTPTQAPLF